MFRTYSSLLEDIREKNSLRIFYLKNRLYKDISIDIIMPTFNRADSIGASIDSILNQTHTNWNLYVWDDGSTDCTEEYCAQFGTNNKIHYFKSEVNRGVSYARNQCLDLSKSHIVTYLDSDNQWSPDYLQTVCAFMVKSKLECTYLHYYTFYPSLKLIIFLVFFFNFVDGERVYEKPDTNNKKC